MEVLSRGGMKSFSPRGNESLSSRSVHVDLSLTPLCFLLKTWRLFVRVRFYCSQQRDGTHLSFECMACQDDCSLSAGVRKIIDSLICSSKTNIQTAKRKFPRKFKLWSLIPNSLILFLFFFQAPRICGQKS